MAMPAVMDEVEHFAEDHVIQPDAVAAIVRSPEGKFRTHQPAPRRRWRDPGDVLGICCSGSSASQVQPGTSALFRIIEQMTADKALDAPSKYGGSVLKTSLSKEAEAELQKELHGRQHPSTIARTERPISPKPSSARPPTSAPSPATLLGSTCSRGHEGTMAHVTRT